MAYIYKLINGTECVYIGKAGTMGDLHLRIGSHYKNKDFTDYEYRECPDEKASFIEKELIKLYKPRYNKIHNKNPIKTQQDLIEHCEKMLGKAYGSL